jgi:hypothetical protein
MDAADETSRVSKVPWLADPCILQRGENSVFLERTGIEARGSLLLCNEIHTNFPVDKATLWKRDWIMTVLLHLYA